ncbi:MAG: PP2C family serine/threonine-protein phosphatase [Acutalibacteraceae bacterium]|nr:PP2C family serine/threonine-protein phosphatase [Acutalibacteraceae bacterium]
MANLFAKAAVGSDIGISRSNNEDNYFLNGKFANYEKNNQSATAFQPPVTEGVFAVFDGMGGQSRGEFASLTAAQTLELYKDDIARGNTHKIFDYISDVNTQLCNEMKKNNERIGSTAAILTISDGVAQAYNLGDSSIYHLSKRKITKLTRDHTVADQLYRMNALTEEEARKDVRKHSLTKHLGMFAEENDIKPYASGNIRVSNGDMFLLCTDGITNTVTEKDIKKLLYMFDGRCKKSVNALIEMAIENGSDDNLTAMVVRIVNSTNSSTIKRKISKHPRFYPFLLGVGISAVIFVTIITIILSYFT